MRFLCFHGRGTNSQIMESQIAALRHELDTVHSYDFVEGTLASPLAPELIAFFPSSQTYYNYFSAESADSILNALKYLAEFIEIEGPYDGLIAFSMGATLAATYLIQQAIHHREQPLPFKCAVFLSGGAPLDPLALEHGEVRTLKAELNNDQLLPGFPTAHIWGRDDDLWGDRSMTLYELCDPKERTMFLHEEGHAVPGAKAMEALLGSIRAIRRTVGRAATTG